MAELINLEEYIMDCRNCRYHSERDGGKCTYPGGWQWDPVKQRCGTFLWKNGNPRKHKEDKPK